ncbi:MAG: DNA-protecting protein DprA [Nitrosopumilus sp.]|nr:DNA-protecting protein DprA [Nitrosopumilus sp.]
MVAEPEFKSISVEELLGRPLNDVEKKIKVDTLFVEGSLKIPLPCPKVSIIGSRKASPQGIENAQRIAKTLIENQVIIVSGLAEGIDTAGHKTAIRMNGKTIAVLGTPLNKTFPAKNFELQQEIMKNHLAVSQFPVGYPTRPKDFVIRNRTMALISDASVIVEAGKSSGSLHQGWETLRLGRPLFIWESVVNNKELDWPKEMMEYGAMELSDPFDILEVLPTRFEMIDVFQ